MALSRLQRAEAWVNPDGTPTASFANIIETLIQESEEMTTNARLAQIRPDSTSAQSIYTAPDANTGGRGTVITQFSATDPANTATFDVHIGTSATNSTLLVNNDVADAVGGSPPYLINAMIAPGESLYVTASAADTIVFLVSGIERRS